MAFVPRDYERSSIVEAMNGVPRFTGGQDFEPQDSNYLLGVGLIALPWGITALFTVIALMITYLCACCCRPKSKKDGGGSIVCKVLLVVFAVAACAGVGLAFYGNVLSLSGLSDAEDAFDDLHSSWTEAISLADQAEALSGEMADNTVLYDQTCGENQITDLIRDGLTQFDDALTVFNSFAADTDDVFENTKDGIALAGQVITYAGFVILGIGALILVVAFVGVFVSGSGSCDGCSSMLRCIMLPIAIIIVGLLWIMVGVMAADVAICDYCMDPDDNLSKLTDDDDIAAILDFYVDCQGENPLFTEYSRARLLFLGVDGLVELLRQQQQLTCAQGASIVDALEQNVDDMLALLDDIRDIIECETINVPYQTAAYDALCDDWQMALFFTWIGALVCALFFGIVVKIYDHANGRQGNCCCPGGDPDD